MTRLTPAVALRYAAFALAATAANLGTQYALFAVYDGPARLAGALAFGTAAGLVVKYALDALWIFHDAGGGLTGHARKFSRYTATGILTTAIFWGTELLVAAFTQDPHLYLLGGALGLVIGYVVKFHLDRRFVFRSPAA